MGVERFVNQLMTSNCYVVVDDKAKRCVCIDPASEKSEREIAMIERGGLTLDYILLTHEHTDHTWGVNALKERYGGAEVICTEACRRNLEKECRSYFLFYYDDADYHYTVCRVDRTTDELGGSLDWRGHHIGFMATPGHSRGSVCIEIEGTLFTGDTMMPYKPYFSGRGSDKERYWQSVGEMCRLYADNTVVHPGHGEPLTVGEWRQRYGQAKQESADEHLQVL